MRGAVEFMAILVLAMNMLGFVLFMVSCARTKTRLDMYFAFGGVCITFIHVMFVLAVLRTLSQFPK